MCCVLCAGRERYESPQEIAAIWKDYFFFGFIRNPWSRAYSLYKDMTATNHFLHKHGRRCSMEWGRFCRQPFAEFDRLYGEGCSHKEPHYAYWHMMDQYHCMITPTGGWAVDFLGRVESGSEDWKVIVQEMNKRRLPGVPEVPFSALDHKHKVDTPALLQQAGQQQGNGVPAAAAAGAAASSQQQQLLPQHTRLPAHLLQEQQEQQQQQQSHMGRLFRQLWRRVRLATAAANEAAAEAYGVVDDFVAGAASQQNPDANGALGPYSGANEHCVDAVSEWFACDIEKFGYLPPLEATNATGGSNGTTAAGGVAAAANASVAAAAANTTAAGAANVTAAAAANAANVTGAAAGNATASRNATSAGNTTAAPNVTGAGSAAAGQPRAAAAAAAAGQPPPPPPPAAAAAGATKAANASAGAAAGAAQGAGAGTALGSMLGSNAPVQVSQAQV
jgi:hypothetical protein